MCLTKLTRRIFFCHVLLHIIFQLQFTGIIPEKDLRLFCSPQCFLETEQKHTGKVVLKVSATVQQGAVGLTPAANYAVMRFGGIRPYVWLQCSQYGPGFSKAYTGMGENKWKHVRCNAGFSYEILSRFLLGVGLFTFKGNTLGIITTSLNSI